CGSAIIPGGAGRRAEERDHRPQTGRAVGVGINKADGNLLARKEVESGAVAIACAGNIGSGLQARGQIGLSVTGGYHKLALGGLQIAVLHLYYVGSKEVSGILRGKPGKGLRRELKAR